MQYKRKDDINYNKPQYRPKNDDGAYQERDQDYPREDDQ